MASVLDVADSILAETGPIDAWTLQKLTYYCQAWSLAHRGEVLYPEAIEAWKNGPVVRKLWATHRGQYSVQSVPGGDAAGLNAEEHDFVRSVVGRYAHLPASALVALTHREPPWRDARGDLSDDAPSSTVISPEALVAYYGRFGFDERRGAEDALGSLGLEGTPVHPEDAELVRAVASGAMTGDMAVRQLLAGR